MAELPAPDSRVAVHAVIAEVDGDVTLRRADNDELGLFVRPYDLDGDGEFHLTVTYLGEALRVLGINAVDLFPRGPGR